MTHVVAANLLLRIITRENIDAAVRTTRHIQSQQCHLQHVIRVKRLRGGKRDTANVNFVTIRPGIAMAGVAVQAGGDQLQIFGAMNPTNGVDVVIAEAAHGVRLANHTAQFIQQRLNFVGFLQLSARFQQQIGLSHQHAHDAAASATGWLRRVGSIDRMSLRVHHGTARCILPQPRSHGVFGLRQAIGDAGHSPFTIGPRLPETAINIQHLGQHIARRRLQSFQQAADRRKRTGVRGFKKNAGQQASQHRGDLGQFVRVPAKQLQQILSLRQTAADRPHQSSLTNQLLQGFECLGVKRV